MKHVVQFSGGVCSFFTAQRVIEKFGKDDVILLFADTLMEDEDLYRFLDESANFLGVPVTKIADGRTPWQVFHDVRMLGNSQHDPCSKILKRDLLWRWMKEHTPGATVYFGLDWTEEHRLERVRQRRPGWAIEAPMMWRPLVDKPDMLKNLAKIGIKPCRLYEQGYPHANCSGACCKAGQSQWRLLLEVNREGFLWHEQQEQELRSYLNKNVSILRDRRGGVTKPLTLKAFRERIEGGGEHDCHDWGGCGCGVD